MTSRRFRGTALVLSAMALLGTGIVTADSPWAGQQFLSDYSKLQEVPGKQGKEYYYVAPGVGERMMKYRSVLLDQPEIFISDKSPYKGAKPEDLAAIAAALRSTAAAELTSRGYVIAEKPAADALYVRIAVTDLQIEKKKRGLLSYTPVGLVVNAGMKALQDFMDKNDILDMSVQAEVQDSLSGEVLGAAVSKRGKSTGEKKAISFDALTAVMTDYGARLACRIDNGYVPVAERIDCLDPAARKARPQVVGK